MPRRGPRRSLDLDAVVAAATAIAREQGLAVVTMREVARALGVVPMTLYTCLPGKAELLDLMLDAAYGQMPRSDTTGQPWRQRLATIADESRALFDAHPWAIAVSTRRPPLGPGSIAKYEYELSALAGLGLSDLEMDDCLTYLLDFVQTSARAAGEVGTARQASAMTDQQWWEQAGPSTAPPWRSSRSTRRPSGGELRIQTGAAPQETGRREEPAPPGVPASRPPAPRPPAPGPRPPGPGPGGSWGLPGRRGCPGPYVSARQVEHSTGCSTCRAET